MKKGDRRFLIVLLVTMGFLLLVLLSSVSMIGGTRGARFARHTAVLADIEAINVQLREYKAMNGFYPTTEQGLQALVIQSPTEPRPSHWLLFKEVPRDPWGNDYLYRCPGIKKPDTYDLFSAGPDGIADTADDIGKNDE